ncbi:hypothetical protein EK0264_10695 [Epidermidibacterium keratini]|uniref:Uncharacterized protein n=1 Tax=Epidermidibacterium keratini TaxID=1891644 RepID=A0A7L4YNH8_9ACTN|nr:hypothetical protein [Epidermidibacterium keratini]QHC00710.1 hypothetical protein EK0264_10695 [Epidermidibacterium keratini]
MVDGQPAGRPAVPTSLEHIADAERTLMLVDRIIALENKLAEERHRFASRQLAESVAEHEEREALRSPLELRFPRTSRAYSATLRVPVAGGLARRVVKAAKSVGEQRANRSVERDSAPEATHEDVIAHATASEPTRPPQGMSAVDRAQSQQDEPSQP